MYYLLYDSNGIIVSGPFPNQKDAQRLAALKNLFILETSEKVTDFDQKRVDLVTLELRDWTQEEIDARELAKAQDRQARAQRKDNAVNDIGTGTSVPDLQRRVDNIVRILQDHNLV